MADKRSGILALLFAIYLALLVWLVLWKLHVPYIGGGDTRGIKLIPFVAGEGFGPSATSEVLANAVLFVPFGVYLAALAPSWPWWKALGMIVGASLALEMAQYVLAAGSTDITDVIVNSAGGPIGTAMIAIARRGSPLRAAAIITRVCAIGTVAALLAVGLVIAAFPRFSPPLPLSLSVHGDVGSSVSCRCSAQ